jgi:hypothetical protein
MNAHQDKFFDQNKNEILFTHALSETKCFV